MDQRTNSRNSGIPLIGGTDWGTNICLFYETRNDLLQGTAAFFEAGLRGNEYCIWAVSDPITPPDAIEALHQQMPEINAHVAQKDIEITTSETWNLKENEFNLQRIAGGWNDELVRARERGYDGLRISGNASWLETEHWKEFCEYDRELDRCVSGREMILLCTHSLSAKRAFDIPVLVRAHHFTVYRRQDKWDFAETTEMAAAVGDSKLSNFDFYGASDLTQREKVVVAQIIQGKSSREIGRDLGISPRTIEFHRANIMNKTGAKNVADLTRIVTTV